MSSSAPPPSISAAGAGSLADRRVAFTTPPHYSTRISRVLSLAGAATLPLPTVSVVLTPQTLTRFLHEHSMERFDAVAFTSRAGISAFSLALDDQRSLPKLLSEPGPTFTAAALGVDAELLYESGLAGKLCGDPTRIRILVPAVASPSGLVKALGFGHGRRILCPIPSVVDLTEPSVIPDFIKELEEAGWIPERVIAYETRWMGPKCVEGLVSLEGDLDAILFTSTAEVEGLLKGLDEFKWDWGMVRKRWPEIVVGAHGPVTAKGAEKFGVSVDVVSEKFTSFDGIVDALEQRWGSSHRER